MNKIKLIMDFEDAGLSLEIRRIEKFLAYVLIKEGIKKSKVNVILTDNEQLALLNETYKKREGITDVLSFDLSENERELIGEIYISVEKAIEQASEYAAETEEEIVRLSTHGILHLAGQIHKTDEELKKFTEHTEELMKKYFEGGV